MIYLGNSPVGVVAKVPTFLDIPKKDDGNAYVYVYLPDPTDLDIKIYIQSSGAQYTVDWGDGNTETKGDSTYIEHTYSNTGFYTIKLVIISGSPRLGGSGNIWLIGGALFPERANCAKLYGLETGTWGIQSNEFLYSSNVVVLYAKKCTYLNYGFINAYQTRLLRNLELPEIAQDYNGYQFNSCFSLRSVRIPSAVTRIGQTAFRSCGKLGIHMEASTPPTLGADAFVGDTITIYVPTGSLATYQAAENWSTYANNMVEE